MINQPVTISIASRYKSKYQAKNYSIQTGQTKRTELSLPSARAPSKANMHQTFSISGFQYGPDSNFQDSVDENLPKIKKL
jgi:hypothetical protein